ncbi:MAG: alpha/beta-type small acid-soluble spore protein [Ruminococcaceae bacterium]|nr:alpha/beta-type small acid-soluble spore protein [Oscillospiraceae bacterium]
MANSNKRNLVPEARAALDKFKMEAANEVGVNLKEGYNGDLTSKQAGSVGGQMVNLMTPQQQWKFQRTNRNVNGHMMDINFTMVVGL